MSGALHFDPIRLPPECVRLRQEVREFLRDELDSGRRGRRKAFNREFSRKVGAKGWIGMTRPQKYGGRGRRISPARSSRSSLSRRPCG